MGKILKRIFGLIETDDRWRARYYNDELYELYKEADLETHIRCQRLRWLGHIRMENTRKVKIFFNNNPEGARLRGRPRTRWWN